MDSKMGGFNEHHVRRILFRGNPGYRAGKRGRGGFEMNR
jgi:hypothetical protein